MKKRIREKGFVAGTWCEIPSSYSVNAAAKAGMDFVIIDMEHGVMNFETAQEMVFAAQCESGFAFIRVPKLEESFILRALDTGADGIVIPRVEGIEDIKKIVEYSKFPPAGKRGFNPFIRAGNYGAAGRDFFKEQNKKVMTAVILEGAAAFENIEKLASAEHIDIYYIGQYDLSAALGCPGDIWNKKVMDMLKKAADVINKNGKLAGCMVHDIRGAVEMKKAGIKFIVKGTDTGILCSEYRKFADELGGINK